MSKTVRERTKRHLPLSSSRWSRGNFVVLALFLLATISFGTVVVFRSHAAYTLSWAPPSGYTSYPVKTVTSSTALTTLDGGGGDMWVKLGSSPVGPITLQNCRNVVIMGGQINLLNTAVVNSADQRGIYVKGCTGTVHIEGVYVNGDTGTAAEGDGIAISAPSATVQIENVRVNKLRGGNSTNHSDVVQPWGGVNLLRIDHLTGTSNYQGLQLTEDQGPITSAAVMNTNIASSEVTPIDKGGQFIWMSCPTYPISLTNVYIQPRSGRSDGTSVWPQNDGQTSCPASIDGTRRVTWPAMPVTGYVQMGAPTSDYVPAGTVGIGYTSPGYGGATPTPTPTPSPAVLVGDINNDSKVNAVDLSVLLTKWGTNDISADINHDNSVNAVDLSTMLSRWTG